MSVPAWSLTKTWSMPLAAGTRHWLFDWAAKATSPKRTASGERPKARTSPRPSTTTDTCIGRAPAAATFVVKTRPPAKPCSNNDSSRDPAASGPLPFWPAADSISCRSTTEPTSSPPNRSSSCWRITCWKTTTAAPTPPRQPATVNFCSAPIALCIASVKNEPQQHRHRLGCPLPIELSAMAITQDSLVHYSPYVTTPGNQLPIMSAQFVRPVLNPIGRFLKGNHRYLIAYPNNF